MSTFSKIEIIETLTRVGARGTLKKKVFPQENYIQMKNGIFEILDHRISNKNTCESMYCKTPTFPPRSEVHPNSY